jgi:hypothetical protein
MHTLRIAIAALALAAAAPSLSLAWAADAPNGKPKTALAPVSPMRDPDAPPEGKGPSGLDFGAWRTVAPQRSAGAFAAEVARIAAQGDLRASLEKDGFGCFDPHRPGLLLMCTRSALEGACGYDWTVELRAGAQAAPTSRFEAHCLTQRSAR